MPTASFHGNGTRVKFELPGHLDRTCYVGGVLTTPSAFTDSSVTFSVAPGSGVPVQIDFVTAQPKAPPAGSKGEYRTTGTTAFTIPNGVETVILAGSGTIAATMPSLPFDGQEILVVLETAHTAVTFPANTGQTIVAGAAMLVVAGSHAYYRYRASNAKWYRVG